MKTVAKMSVCSRIYLVGLGMGKANVAVGEAPGETEAVGEMLGVGVGVGVGGGGMMFSQ